MIKVQLTVTNVRYSERYRQVSPHLSPPVRNTGSGEQNTFPRTPQMAQSDNGVWRWSRASQVTI